MIELLEADPLLDESALPFGAPDFARIDTADFLPAFRTALAEAKAEIAAIANDPAPATFDNSIAQLERSGARLARIRRIFWTLSSARSDAAMRAIETDISAMLTAHGTAISHDAKLFARIRSLWEARESAGLDEAQMRLVDDRYRGFVDGGALLDAAGKARFAELSQQLSALGTQFGQNVLAAADEWELLLDADDLDGLPQPMCESAASSATERGHDGRYLFTLDRGDAEGLLTFSRGRDLRETMWRAFTGRCDGGPHDNRALVDAILALRQERAAMLGYPSYADYALVDSMAKTPEAASGLLMRVWTPALRQAQAEQEELQRLADADGITLAPWDWRFYAEQVRRDRYALDGGEVKKHLTLDRVREAAFGTASRLYGLRFQPRTDLPGWHEDVTAWAVSETDGTPLGLLYTDYLARAGKHGGAWMGSLRVQEKIDGPVLPIAYLVANFAKAPPGADTGLSIDEARTLFHEFGHALHALLSDVTYPSQAGTAVPRDFVEFPSKFMEHWIVAPETLAGFGVPPALIAAIGQADDFGEGFATVEFLASAILDLELHRSADAAPDSRALEAEILARIAMPAIIVPRHGLAHFTHVFDGGYAAAYYSYLWSEVLDADAFAAFGEAGSIFDPALAARFRKEVLAPGNSRDPADSFIAFRGRDPDEAALLQLRGFG
ncbi:M3 family metallopeptidase [Sphingomonas sp. M1-B02]|uniref:M3 family metallopeptidase n=1 Tax=Sphingomonas sp. M1-B02 TaxID=3114300 RepID=UPI0022401B9D|nr:M3 family metallopeptidase [Sphingomonas sp. S6-11]UZK67660.1 M3 family metallopeptidase [Sphingomonas sp. S6-11]